jgi:hypothetical protein
MTIQITEDGYYEVVLSNLNTPNQKALSDYITAPVQTDVEKRAPEWAIQTAFPQALIDLDPILDITQDTTITPAILRPGAKRVTVLTAVFRIPTEYKEQFIKVICDELNIFDQIIFNDVLRNRLLWKYPLCSETTIAVMSHGLLK